MPKRDEAPIGAPCWVDLFTSDPDRSRAFYSALFGWTPEEPNQEFGGYFNFTKDGVRIAGGMRNDGSSGQPDGWSVYLATDDAEKTVAGATAHGGQVMVPPMAVGDLGTMAVVSDPGDAVIGMWQPAAHKGFGLLSEAGAPSWFELHTRDYDAAVDFYRTVFRWETSVVGDVPEFRYTTLTVGDDMFAGIMDAGGFLPEGVPAHWSVYYGTDDADASVDLVRKLGGTVVTVAEDTPYGRLATASDPTGAVFKLRQAPAAS